MFGNQQQFIQNSMTIIPQDYLLPSSASTGKMIMGIFLNPQNKSKIGFHLVVLQLDNNRFGAFFPFLNMSTNHNAYVDAVKFKKHMQDLLTSIYTFKTKK
jgi:hypothetical protein